MAGATPRRERSTPAGLSITVALSGLAAVIALVILFVPALGALFVFAGAYSGKPFPTAKKPAFEVPETSGLIRALLIIVGLVVLGVGIQMAVNGTLIRLIRPDQGKTISSSGKTFEWRETAVFAAGPQSPAVQRPIESFYVHDKRSMLLRKPPFSSGATLVVGDATPFSVDLLVVQNPKKYPALLTAGSQDVITEVELNKNEVRLPKSKLPIGGSDILLKQSLRVKGSANFTFNGQDFTLLVCKIDYAVIGSDYVEIGIGKPGLAACK